MKNKVIISISIAAIAFSIYNGYSGYKSVSSVDSSTNNKQATVYSNRSPNVDASPNELDSPNIPLSKLDRGTFLDTRLHNNSILGGTKTPQDSFLNGIIYSDSGDNIAIVDNQPIKIGDPAFGGDLVEIQRRYIVIKYSNGNSKRINYTNKRKLK